MNLSRGSAGRQVAVNDRVVVDIVWAPPARPFSEKRRWYPRAGLGPARCLMTATSTGTWRDWNRYVGAGNG